jgi:hypothetical protein
MMGIGVLLLLLIVVILSTQAGKKLHVIISAKKNIWILGGYILLLLVSTVVFHLLPKENFIVGNASTTGTSVSEHGFYLFEKLINKEEIEKEFVKEKNMYVYEGSELLLKGYGYGQHEYDIMLERVPDLYDQIEVTIYTAAAKINGVDVSDQIPSPSYHFKEESFAVEKPLPVIITMSYLNKEFPFKQYSGDKWMDYGSGSSFSYPIIYLRVPKGLEVNWEQDLMVTEIE